MVLRHIFGRSSLWSRVTAQRKFCNRSLRSISKSENDMKSFKNQLNSGPSLTDFIRGNIIQEDNVSSLADEIGKSVFFETYGCQMNVNDTEVAWSILHKNGYSKSSDIQNANVVLIMTCSIREGAETKIWKRLNYLKSLKKLKKRKKENFQICILGCMAERLKEKLIDHVDVICGPDAYKDLPNLLHRSTMLGASAMNVALSLEETYADVTPLRLNKSAVSAFVSIMRGCDNMCSYCIVPFTRGRERSRPINSIISEIEKLADQGVKEVTLLGQNVNSYRDTTSGNNSIITQTSSGFKTVYKPKKGGKRFAELISSLAEKVPNMRIRFTSPHPKDFPDELLYAINEYPNICKQIHLPAQSGSSKVLQDMRRGYTRDAYLELVDHIRSVITDIALSSDFIAGFCGETEEDHSETLSLMQLVKYNYSFCFPYSLREKTRAYHRLNDDVPQEVKSRRHMELIDQFRKDALEINNKYIGQEQLILIECDSKRSNLDWAGRNDQNIKVILPKQKIYDPEKGLKRDIEIGDFVAVKINSATSQTLKGSPIHFTSIKNWNNVGKLNRLNNVCI